MGDSAGILRTGGFAGGALLLAILTGQPAAAATPSYKYAEVAYSTGSLDIDVSGLGSVDIDEDGFELEGSFSFLEDQFWVTAFYSDLSGDEQGVDLDIESLGLGLGWIFKVTDTTSVDASLIYREDELSALGDSADVDGIGIAVGARSNVTDMFEVFGRVGYLEGDYEGGFTLDFGGVVNINERFAVSISYELLNADDEGVEIELGQFQLGGRVKF